MKRNWAVQYSLSIRRRVTEEERRLMWWWPSLIILRSWYSLTDDWLSTYRSVSRRLWRRLVQYHSRPVCPGGISLKSCAVIHYMKAAACNDEAWLAQPHEVMANDVCSAAIYHWLTKPSNLVAYFLNLSGWRQLACLSAGSAATQLLQLALMAKAINNASNEISFNGSLIIWFGSQWKQYIITIAAFTHASMAADCSSVSCEKLFWSIQYKRERSSILYSWPWLQRSSIQWLSKLVEIWPIQREVIWLWSCQKLTPISVWPLQYSQWPVYAGNGLSIEKPSIFSAWPDNKAVWTYLRLVVNQCSLKTKAACGCVKKYLHVSQKIVNKCGGWLPVGAAGWNCLCREATPVIIWS